jgi:galactokinase
VPIGAGLSSSAALECATCFALNELLGLKLERREMVKIAQEAEHTFAGVRVGIMDMFASLFGKKDQVIKLDCRSMDFEYVPFQLKGMKLVLFNTNVKHSLASSAYNNRRQQCEQGVAWVKERYPQVKSLRDVSVAMLQELVEPKDEVVYRRCRYVVEENERVLKGVEDLKRGDLVALGKKMFQTHEGLSKLYEVSSAELDFLITFVKKEPGVLGARMMGGGFGGCTINIVQETVIEGLIEKISEAYYSSLDLELTTYIVEIEQGTSTITDF